MFETFSRHTNQVINATSATPRLLTLPQAACPLSPTDTWTVLWPYNTKVSAPLIVRTNNTQTKYRSPNELKWLRFPGFSGRGRVRKEPIGQNWLIGEAPVEGVAGPTGRGSSGPFAADRQLLLTQYSWIWGRHRNEHEDYHLLRHDTV
jgi:hypothetical protein